MQASTPRLAEPASPATPNLSGPLGAVGSSLRLGPLQPSPDLMSLEQWVSSQTGDAVKRCGSSAELGVLRSGKLAGYALMSMLGISDANARMHAPVLMISDSWSDVACSEAALDMLTAEEAELTSQEALWGSPVTQASAVRLCSSAPSLLLPTAPPPPRATTALRSQSGPNPFDDLPSGFAGQDGAAGSGWLPNPFEAACRPAGPAGLPPRVPPLGADPDTEGAQMKRANSLPTLLACERWQEDVTARRSDSVSRLRRAAGAPAGSTRRHSVGKCASAEALAFRLMATLPEDKPALLPADAAHGSHLHMTFNPIKPEVLMTPYAAGSGSAKAAGSGPVKAAVQQLTRVTRSPSAPASPVKIAKAFRAPLRLQRASKSAPHAVRSPLSLGPAAPAPWPPRTMDTQRWYQQAQH